MVNPNQNVLKIKLTDSISKSMSAALNDIDGVDKLELIPPQYLRITYDVTKTTWMALREQLQSQGVYSHTGILMRWRDGWRDFLEQNMRDNLQHKPACCSKPPAGGGVRSRSTHDG